MAKPPHIYFYLQANKPKGRRIAEAVQAGLGTSRVTIMPPGDNFHGRGITMMWGAWHNTLPIYRRCVKEGLPFVYWDNGYFGYKRQQENWHRAVWCGLQHTDLRPPNASGKGRLRRMSIKIEPWRKKKSNKVLVPLQTEGFYERFLGKSRDEWTSDVVRQIKAAGMKPIIRDKPVGKIYKALPKHQRPPDLATQLRDCHAVVGYTTAVMIEAVLLGIPVFPTHPCAASPMGTSDLVRLSNPVYPDNRRRWAERLAGQCWNEADLRSGIWWNELERPV